ncbi:MAG: sodium:proline symporter [bacterium]|nr:sodium:proline symporter [bacterium]
MNLHPVDWLVVAVPLIVVLAVAWYTRRHVQCVSDFMTGGRIAGRYLVAVSDGIATMGLITIVAFFEFFYRSGFAVNYWSQLQVPVTLLLALTGFVIFRFRETRAMTLAQFFELRYSRRFRQFAGWLAAIAGIINYGIFPAVAARFFIHYVGLPETVALGGVSLPTFAVFMLIFLGAALLVVLFGGQVAIMVSDCLQGMLTFAMIFVVTVVVLSRFRWGWMCEALLDRPSGESMLNPFDSFGIQDFNIWFALIGVIGSVYMTMAWQGNQGYNCAAASPHEAKMGKLLGGWRTGITYAMVLLLAVAAFTFLNHDAFAEESVAAKDAIANVADPTVRTQIQVPVAIAHFLPIGVSGMFLATMLFLMLSTDTTYLHSWGSIVVQDVILPLRKKPFTPEGQLRYLRWSIVGVAVFAFLFSLLFRQTTYILMFFALTGAVYLGGAGSCIIGGLYWSRGTTRGAWAAMITGVSVALLGFVMEHGWPYLATRLLARYPDSEFLQTHGDRFFINGQWVWFFSLVAAIAVYVLVSLGTCRRPFDMDRLLHRGRYAPADDPPRTEKAKSLLRLVGIDRHFSRRDRIIAAFVFYWSMGQFAIWTVVTVWNVFAPWPSSWWSTYFWAIGVSLVLLGSVVPGVWFTWGGIGDLRRFFARLKTLERHVADDGRVIGHVNADEADLDRMMNESGADGPPDGSRSPAKHT